MASFVFIPGAGGAAWYWHRVLPLLAEAGHDAQAVDLPGADDKAGLDVYADLVVKATCNRQDVTLVAQSLGGFTAPLVCERAPVRQLILVNAMIPMSGETAGAWWDQTQSHAAQVAAAKRGGYSEAFDLHTHFLHDVPPDVIEASSAHQRNEASIAFQQPCAFKTWPKTLHVVAGRDDRFFPLEFQQRIARERLGKDVDVVPGGHLNALSRPQELAQQIMSYLA